MSEFSATDAAFSGIRFVREHPRTVATWAGLQIIISLVAGVVFVWTLGPYLVQLQALSQPGQRADPAQVMAIVGPILPAYAVFFVCSLLFYALLWATMARAVLEPANEGFGYIRFGMDEARQLLLILLWMVVTVAAYVVGIVLLLVPLTIGGILSRSLGPGIGLVCGLAVCAAMLYCAVRLSLASPLTFDGRRVDLFGSWALTRGHFWKLLGTYLLVLGVGLVILFLALIIAVAVAVVLGGMGAAASVFRPNMASVGAYLVPARLGTGLVWALVTPLLWALFLMPPAEIYRQLRGDALK